MIKTAESKPSLLDLVNEWLERMPFFEGSENWPTAQNDRIEQHPFWSDYAARYVESLMPNERFNLRFFNQVFFGEEDDASRRLSPKACRAALFIFLFRGYPMLQTPFQLLNLLLEIDEQLSTWRYRHINMVHRMIGTRTGTGGSTGKDYLKGALDKHYIFKEIAGLASFLIERQNLPKLSPVLDVKLGFRV